MNVPKTGSKVPPVPDVLDQTPPGCSPFIKFERVIVAVLVSHIVILSSNPALGCAFILTVTSLSSAIHGAVPETVYLNTDVVALTAGVNSPEAALKVPPVPDTLTQVPPVCALVNRPNKVMILVLVSHTVVAPSAPALGCAVMVTVAKLSSLIQGVVPAIV